MPTIVDYELVQSQMTTRGFRCNYYNSGAFGFSPDAAISIRGWIGSSSIRPPSGHPSPRWLANPARAPYETTLARLFVKAAAGRDLLPGHVCG